MILFHGSNIEVADPRLLGQTRGLDFGAGFYLTTSGEQAERFSHIVANRQKKGIAMVNVYEFDMEAAEKTLSIRRFLGADAEWLEFITDNRLKTYSGETYDVVIGAVANDTVMPTIQAYLGGFLTKEAALVTLKTSRLVDQLCLKTDKALSLLRFVRAYSGNKGVIRMHGSISPVIAMITPGIIQLLMENRSLTIEEASDVLYNSELYKALEDEGTKVWRLSYPLLYDLLVEELETGRMTYPEEQIG